SFGRLLLHMESTATSTLLDNRFTEFNVRHDVGTPHFVRLHDNATKRFETYLRGLAPARGGIPGAGGILLGTVELTDQWSTTVHDFTPVLCEHRRDGRSTFLDCPARCFHNAIRRASQGAKKNLSIVGCYRTHARPEFSLEKEDHDLFRKYFLHDGQFLLLIRPPPATFAMGAFYLSLKGQLDSERSSVEFPLSLKELGAEDTPEVEEMESSVIIPASLPLESAAAAPVATSAPVAAAPPAEQL